MQGSDKNSINSISNESCTGCKMCGDICPVNAISYKDVNGFWTPKVNTEKCINCGICLNRCPVGESINQIHWEHTLQCCGIINPQKDIRLKSTSGGFFYTLACDVLKNNGYVAGAVFDSNNDVKHIITKDISDLDKLMKSKYAQSNTEGIYKAVRKLVVEGELVLFTGTPCQVVALKQYIGKEYPNLITLDFICCGISSPTIFSKYKAYMEKRYKSKIKSIEFKNKENGWRAISTRIDFINGKVYLEHGVNDPYMVSFVIDGNNMRESCYSCKFRRYEHMSDFTAGDFWGMEKKYKSYDDNKGCTALMINSAKGIDIFNRISEMFIFFLTDIDSIAEGNSTLYKDKGPSSDRKAFINEAVYGNYKKAIRKYSKYGKTCGLIPKIKRKLEKMIS